MRKGKLQKQVPIFLPWAPLQLGLGAGGQEKWVKMVRRYKLPICKQVIGISIKGRKRFYSGNTVS